MLPASCRCTALHTARKRIILHLRPAPSSTHANVHPVQLRKGLGDDDVPQPRAQVVHELRHGVAQRRGNVLGGVADLQAGIFPKVRQEGRDIHISVATLCRCRVFGGVAHGQAGIFPSIGQGGMNILIFGAREHEYSPHGRGTPSYVARSSEVWTSPAVLQGDSHARKR